MLTEQARKLIPFIQENCGPWLSEAGMDDVVYRGTRAFPEMALAAIKPVRPDRRPKDSNKQFHEIYQTIIDIAGGRAHRENSMFVTGFKNDTVQYGTPHIVFPMGNYSYTWSSLFRDWYSDIEEKLNPLGAMEYLLGAEAGEILNRSSEESIPLNDQINLMSDPGAYDPSKIKKYIHVDQGIDLAIQGGYEIMIACDKAIYFDLAFYNNFIHTEGRFYAG